LYKGRQPRTPPPTVDLNMRLTTMVSVFLLGVVLVAHADEPNPLAGLGLVGSRPNSTLAALPSVSFGTRDSTTFGTRAAIPACLKAVELSCSNLTANCIDGVNSEVRLSCKMLEGCFSDEEQPMGHRSVCRRIHLLRCMLHTLILWSHVHFSLD
jgi:hypothetical protein